MTKGLDGKSIWRTYKVTEEQIKKLIQYENGTKEEVQESYYDDTIKAYTITTVEEVQ